MHRHVLQFNGRVIEVEVFENPIDGFLVKITASREQKTSDAEYATIYEWFRPIIAATQVAGKAVHVMDPQHVLTT